MFTAKQLEASVFLEYTTYSHAYDNPGCHICKYTNAKQILTQWHKLSYWTNYLIFVINLFKNID
jgi:hypothetical protein